MCALLAAGDEALEAVRTVVESTGKRVPLGDVHLCAPVPRPRKFLGLGLQLCAPMLQEIKDAGIPIEIPDNQVWFNKQVSCITGPYDDDPYAERL